MTRQNENPVRAITHRTGFDLERESPRCTRCVVMDTRSMNDSTRSRDFKPCARSESDRNRELPPGRCRTLSADVEQPSDSEAATPPRASHRQRGALFLGFNARPALPMAETRPTTFEAAHGELVGTKHSFWQK